MYLSDRDIRQRIEKGEIAISPLEDSQIQPASVDIRLGKNLLTYPKLLNTVIHPKRNGNPEPVELELNDDTQQIISPGEFLLGVTYEYVEIPNDLIARIEGKSSLARYGLGVHITAGFVDPGWRGNLTFELFNMSPNPIMITYKMPIAQLVFCQLTSEAEKPYGSDGLNSKYQDSDRAKSSLYHMNYVQYKRFLERSGILSTEEG